MCSGLAKSGKHVAHQRCARRPRSHHSGPVRPRSPPHGAAYHRAGRGIRAPAAARFVRAVARAVEGFSGGRAAPVECSAEAPGDGAGPNHGTLHCGASRMKPAACRAGVIVISMAALGLGCAGFPAKQKPVRLPETAPLDGAEFGGGGEWPASDWWKRYQDPTLDQLIALGLANSPSLATASARFDTARQSVRLAAAAAGAQVTANADINRQRLSDNGIFPPQLLGFTWYNQVDLGLQASYTFDWWGKQRYAVESAMDQAHAAQADRSAAALMLASSIADTYFGWQSDQNRLLLARENENSIESEAKVTAARVRAELDFADDINRSDLALAAAREQMAALEGSARLRIVALAALAGRSAAELPALTRKALP